MTLEPVHTPWPPPDTDAYPIFPGHPIDQTAELGTLRDVARALASGINAREILATLCKAATVRGAANGAIVAEIYADSGTYVAAIGIMSELLGTSFPVAGSITEKVLRDRKGIGATHSVLESSSFFSEILQKLNIGPAVVLPLIAHERLLGTLTVCREVGGPTFDLIAFARLEAVADLAALALWNTRLLEEAREGDAAKTSLLATLSHELRTPLTTLEGYGELLEDEILGPLAPAQRDVIMRLRTVSRHLGSLIEDILTYASLEADRVVARATKVSVDEVVDTLYPFVEPLAREKGIRFRVDVDEKMPLLMTDEPKVRQILINLCQNAVKFTETGEVAVRVSRGSPAADGVPTIRCTVKDTGVGIAAADLQRLFRPFSQVDSSLARRYSGTGLGLYISRRLATLLGGRIEVVSRPGEGSAFTLVLPVTH
ncbi:MAG: GAF domain-containing protein [Phycisphaerae bacterium]|nr:GAF domain-containing protein [Gemmatimonadaceae bacterium]